MPQLQKSTSRPSLRTPTTPSKSRTSATPGTSTKASTTPAKSRVLQAKSPVKPKPTVSHSKALEAEKPVPALSLKEAIALKRAEAKKLGDKSAHGALSTFGSLEEAPATKPDSPVPDDDSLGRLSLRQAIERARSTGSINIATRSLPCLPSALFEIHLGVTPQPLKSVPNEPALPPPSSVELQTSSRRSNNPAWYEAQDLQVMKAWNNQIVEIQPEISLFGSLKTIDLHQNNLTSLPDSICDIMPLTNLDLSHNELTSIPENLFSLPELINLNVSHNKLVSLPFNAPFMGDGTIRRVSTNFFSVTVERASSPSPRLQTLEASNNLINASSIHLRIPASVAKLDLSSNPLDGDGDNVSCQKLVAALGSLTKLTELRMEKADINDEAFPASLSSSAIFPSLRLFDLSETKVTVDSAKAAFGGMKQTLDYDYTTEEPPAGVCRIIIGKKMLKEAWEIEVEKQAKHRSLKARDAEHEVSAPVSPHSSTSVSKTRKEAPKEVVKESWEIEAEKGMLTEGGKRRARAAAAAGERKVLGHGKTPSTVSTASSPSPTPGQSQPTFSLSSPKYYAESTLTLTLPPCTPASKAAGHHRAFSLATAPLMAPAPTTDIAVPIPTLPLSVIVAQPFSNSLRTLILINRRMDRCFALPGAGPVEENLLPNLEELDLENCNLPDTIAVSRGNSGSRTNEPIIPLITKLFHNLQTLNMSYNALAGGLRDTEALSSLILARGGRRGLKHLRIRGNGIKDLDGLQGVASMFKGFREVPGWKLDEVDIRDNNVEKLPPELGLLPLDVFLVDGNVFRVPQRRVWEREGTKGLLSWLRGRID